MRIDIELFLIDKVYFAIQSTQREDVLEILERNFAKRGQFMDQEAFIKFLQQYRGLIDREERIALEFLATWVERCVALYDDTSEPLDKKSLTDKYRDF